MPIHWQKLRKVIDLTSQKAVYMHKANIVFLCILPDFILKNA